LENGWESYKEAYCNYLLAVFVYLENGWDRTAAYQKIMVTQNYLGQTMNGFTMPPKNKKAQQEVTGDPSQDAPKQAKKLNGEKLHTFLALCKRELETTKDVGSGLLKTLEPRLGRSNAKFHLTRGPKYFKTHTFHLPPEECDALIKINENISTFREDGLPYEDLLEVIFTNRVATGQYATGPARDDFIYTTTSDVAADFNIEDENDVPTDLVKEDIDT
ncbi:hypothetical protein GIB67_031075, partial [Kingdonia uniflora]